MAFVRAFDKRGPLRQNIDIDYALLNFVDTDLRNLFREFVKTEYQLFKNTVLSEQPIVTGDMFNGWKFKLSLVNLEVKVRITNKVLYSNYITSGSTIYGGNPFLELAMAEFELEVSTELLDTFGIQERLDEP